MYYDSSTASMALVLVLDPLESIDLHQDILVRVCRQGLDINNNSERNFSITIMFFKSI